MQNKIQNCLFIICFFVFFISPLVWAEPIDKTVTVIVAKKDNLVNICKAWLENPHDWQAVSKFNCLENPNLIYPGQHLRIPAKLLKGIPMDGTLTFVKGAVTAVFPGKKEQISLKKGDVVTQGTEIETGKESAAEITFEDGSSFCLRPGTRINIQTARQRKPHYMIRKLLVPAGKTLMKIKKSTGQDSRFEIQTPSAISAARGTRFRVSVDEKEVTRTEALEGVVGVKGRGEEVVLNPGKGTWVKKGATPNPPEALLPSPIVENLKSLYPLLPVTFNLAPVDRAASFRIFLAKDPEVKDVVKDVVVKPGEPIPPILLDDGKYFCRALSINSAGLEGRLSKPAEFNVRINPLPPFIQKPLENQAFKTDSVELEWLNVADAASYQVQISKDPGFKKVFKSFDGLKCTRKSLVLSGYGDYYFRIRSIAVDGFEGLWSDGLRFTYIAPPKAPATEAPIMDESSITLRWQAMGDGMTYRFQMAKDSLFQEILLDKTRKQADITFDKPEDGGIYYVRTKAIDPDGYSGAFSPAQTFEIEKFPYIEAGVIGTWLLGALLILL